MLPLFEIYRDAMVSLLSERLSAHGARFGNLCSKFSVVQLKKKNNRVVLVQAWFWCRQQIDQNWFIENKTQFFRLEALGL